MRLKVKINAARLSHTKFVILFKLNGAKYKCIACTLVYNSNSRAEYASLKIASFFRV